MICVASHKCQRKICVECLLEKGVEFHKPVLIDMFIQQATQKLKDAQPFQTDQFIKQRMIFKSVLSETETMMKKIWQDLSQSIKQIYEMIEQENNSYINLINQNLAESSYTDLEKLVSIVEGKSNWDLQKNSYLKLLDNIKNGWDHGIKTFVYNSNQAIKKIQFILIEFNRDEGENYQKKVYLYEILDQVKVIEVSIWKGIVEVQRKEKIRDIFGWISKQSNFKLYEILLNQQQTISDVKEKLKKIINILRNILDHPFSQNDYSSDTYKQERLNLIKKIAGNQNIIEFLKFLIHLTSIDDKFIQCGSNGLQLLVQMKVDLTNQSFEDIKIKNTNFIGGNFVRCNFSGSEIENVDISGVNLNGALLLNCKWKNIKMYEQNNLEGHEGPVSQVCFSRDGTTLVSSGGSIYGGGDCSIRIWDVKSGQQKAKLDGHEYAVYSVCFSPDGTTLATASEDKSIRLWDVKTGQQKAKLDSRATVYSVCFSPDGTTLATGTEDKSIRLWDVKSGQQKAKLDGHEYAVYSVCFSPDGTTLATGSEDKSTRLWDVKTGQQKAKLNSHTSYVYSVCFSPDGTTFASGSRDNSIRLWNVKTGQQKAKFDGHQYPVQSVCFSPDGTTLASGSNDKSIRLWDVKTGQQKAKLDGHTSYVLSVCFSPDGTTLASGSNDKSICLWDVQTGQSIEPADKSYKDILDKFQTPLFQQNQLSDKVVNYPKLIISLEPTLYAQGALILKGEFLSHQGNDLKPLLKTQGGYFLESNLELLQKKN